MFFVPFHSWHSISFDLSVREKGNMKNDGDKFRRLAKTSRGFMREMALAWRDSRGQVGPFSYRRDDLLHHAKYFRDEARHYADLAKEVDKGQGIWSFAL